MARTKKDLKVTITIKEKDDKRTTVTVGYENTENASDIEKMTGANIYNVVCDAIKKLG